MKTIKYPSPIAKSIKEADLKSSQSRNAANRRLILAFVFTPPCDLAPSFPRRFLIYFSRPDNKQLVSLLPPGRSRVNFYTHVDHISKGETGMKSIRGERIDSFLFPA